MVKVKTKIRRLSIGMLAISTSLYAGSSVLNVSADDNFPEINPEHEDTMVTIQENNDDTTTLDVNVNESLTVSVTTPSEWASGDAGDFLRNKINLSVASNSASGYTASMYTSTTDAKLLNTDDNQYFIPTLNASNTRGNFPANYWGYSLSTTNSTITTAETDEGNDAAVYAAMTTSTSSPIMIRETNTAGTYSDNIYFGTKADSSQTAGVYSGTVVISVVSGVVDPSTNPVTPTNPARSSDDANVTDNYATYDSTNERSVYTVNSTNTGGRNYTTRTTPTGTTTDTTTSTNNTTTEVIDGRYTKPLGVTETSTGGASTNTALAAGLAVTAGVAATSSLIFFALARRKKDDEDEE